ncbi:MAG: hypothetical protein CMM44_08735 [Rhodospirillaceae bacterium]|nr:hypothetical protein [Rhodospirillaceae bacterium]
MRLQLKVHYFDRINFGRILCVFIIYNALGRLKFFRIYPQSFTSYQTGNDIINIENFIFLI